MDEDTYNKIMSALIMIQDAKVLNTTRAECNAYLEEFKKDPCCFDYMLYILNTECPSHNPMVQFLSLKLIEDWTTLRWNLCDDEEHTAIRNGILALLGNVALYDNSPAIRNRIAKLLVEIAKREYPQRWGHFLQEIVEAHWAENIVSKSKICLMVFEFLAEDCIDADFNSALPLKRRDDIIAGLQDGLEPLLDFTFNWVADIVNHFIASGGDSDDSSDPSSLIVPTLKMLSSILPLAKADPLCQNPHNFSQLAVHLLTINREGLTEIQNAAVEFLHKLCHQKLSQDLFWSLIETFPPAYSHLPPLADESLSDPDSLVFYRILGEALSSLLSMNLEVVSGVVKSLEEMASMKQRGRHVPETRQDKWRQEERWMEYLSVYVQLLATISNHPSRRLASVMIKDWLRIFRDQDIAKVEWFLPLGGHLLSAYFPKSCKARWSSSSEFQSGEALDEVVGVEFNSYEEYIEFHGQLRSQFNTLCGIISTSVPQATVAFVASTTQELIETCSAVEAASGDPQFPNTMDECTLRWEAFVAFLDNAVGGMPTSYYPSPSAPSSSQFSSASSQPYSEEFASLVSTAEAIIRWQPEDAQLLLNCVRCIQNLNPILKHCPDHLGQALAKLFECMDYRGRSYSDPAEAPPSESAGSDTMPLFDSALQVRRRAGSAISVICARCSVTIISAQLIEPLCSTVQRMMESGSLIPSQYSSMLEALVSVGEHLPDIDQRRKLLHDVLGDMVTFVASDEASGVISTAEGLLSACPEYVDRRGKSLLGRVVSACTTIANVSRRSPYTTLPDEVWQSGMEYSLDDLSEQAPFVDVWRVVIPVVVCGIRSVHSMWEPSTRCDIITTGGEGGQSIFREPENDLLSLVGNKCGVDAGVTPQGHTSSWRSVLNELRLQLYQIIGQACIHKVMYAGPYDALDALCSAIGDYSLSMENRHLSMLFKYIIEPLVLNCPPAAGPRVAQVISQVLYGLMDRLPTMWAARPSVTGVAGVWVPAESWNKSSRSFAQFVYWQCSLSLEQDLTHVKDNASILEVARDKIIFDFTKNIADFIGSCCLNRGFLAIQPGEMGTTKSVHSQILASESDVKKAIHGKVGSGENVISPEKQLQLQLRRKTLTILAFGTDLSLPESDSALTEPLLLCTLQLLQVQHSLICQKAVTVCHSLLQMMMVQPCRYLVEFIGSEVFGQGLFILLRQDSWTNDNLLWDVVALLEETYSFFVMGVVSTPHAAGIAVDGASGGSQGSSFQSDLPRQVLLSEPFEVPATLIQSLEGMLTEAKSKKRRRDTFKDFIKSLTSGSQQDDTDGLSKAIIDIPIPSRAPRGKSVEAIEGVKSYFDKLFDT